MLVSLKTNKVFYFVILIISISQFSFGQSNTDKALEKGNEAVILQNQGNYEDAIKLFEEAQKLDPEKFEYPYGAAYCYSQIGNYKKAINTAVKILSLSGITDTVYEILGNAYYGDGQEDKAVETYETGIIRFPSSGRLYMEMGLMNNRKKDFPKALTYFEKGIEVEPQYPDNYYWASKLYCNTPEEVWGMIYGELFMNLEPNSKRADEISKILYLTYKSEIQFKNDTTIALSFTEQTIVIPDNIKDSSNLNIPYGMIYEATLMKALKTEKNIDLASLNRIRKSFVENYYKSGYNKRYPNILLDYQEKIIQSGNFEEYNYWLLKKGDEDGFNEWQQSNKIIWNNFIKWFGDNKIITDNTHKFYRAQYK